MKSKAEIASQDLMGKFNCEQSTLAVFAKDYGLDEKAALRMGAGLGGGCHYGEVCGAILAGCAVVGLKHGNQEPDPEKYQFCRDKTREFMSIVKDKYGTFRCSELLDVDMSAADGRDKARELGRFDTHCKPIIAFVVSTLEELGY